MAINKKQREEKLNEKIEDFKQTGALLAELQASIEQPKDNETLQSTGKKSAQDKISFHLNINKKLHKELKQIALNEDSNITALLLEGLELALKKRGKNINDYL